MILPRKILVAAALALCGYAVGAVFRCGRELMEIRRIESPTSVYLREILLVTERLWIGSDERRIRQENPGNLILRRSSDGALLGSVSLHVAGSVGMVSLYLDRVTTWTQRNGQLSARDVMFLPDPIFGQGYGSEALTAILGYAFSQLKLTAVYADISPDNSPALRLHARLGFRACAAREIPTLLRSGFASDRHYYVRRSPKQ